MVPPEFDESICNQHLMVIETSQCLLPKFPRLLFENEMGPIPIYNVASYATLFIPTSVVHDLIVPLPPVDKQAEIVQLIENQLTGSDMETLQQQMYDFQNEIIN